MSEHWQPIETAPKDGRRFLAGHFDGAEWRYAVGKWNGDFFTAGSVDGEVLALNRKHTHWKDILAPQEQPALSPHEPSGAA